MDFKQLEAFAYVVKLKSFSKAAQQIYLTQPTISAHIRSLEQELDTRLLERGTRTVYPTRTGSILYSYAEKMLNLREEAVCAVRNCDREQTGTLSICASSVPAQYVLPRVMAAFREKYPGLVFQLQQQDSGRVVESILHKEAELGFTGTVVDNRNIVFDKFTSDRLVIITPNTEHFRSLGQGRFDRDLLRKEPILLREQGSGTRKETEAFLRRAGIDPGQLNVAGEFDDPNSIKTAVSQGLGISIISKAAVEDYADFGQLLTFEFNDIVMERSLYLVHRRQEQLSYMAEVFVHFVRNYFEEE